MGTWRGKWYVSRGVHAWRMGVQARGVWVENRRGGWLRDNKGHACGVRFKEIMRHIHVDVRWGGVNIKVLCCSYYPNKTHHPLYPGTSPTHTITPSHSSRLSHLSPPCPMKVQHSQPFPNLNTHLNCNTMSCNILCCTRTFNVKCENPMLGGGQAKGPCQVSHLPNSVRVERQRELLHKVHRKIFLQNHVFDLVHHEWGSRMWDIKQS